MHDFTRDRVHEAVIAAGSAVRLPFIMSRSRSGQDFFIIV